MTSLAFMFGIAPLVAAEGAGANSRHSLGTAVLGGMICATSLSLLIVPVLYVVIKTMHKSLTAPPKREPNSPRTVAPKH